MRSKYFKSKKQFDLEKLRIWYFELHSFQDAPVHKDWTMDYATDYLEEGSRGFGWSLHDFELPNFAQSATWDKEETKNDPMIRSKGKLTTTHGTVPIGNECYTKRADRVGGYMGEILDMFPEAYRGAVWVIRPNFKFKEHIDFPNNETYRIHIPLYTNNQVWFKLGTNTFHMPTDGTAWMIDTGSHKHTAWNYGSTPRVHIHWQMPIDTWDHYFSELS